MGSKNFCYYCGQPASTKEHIPPKFMFKGFNNDSITVPSCTLHNSKKSGADQAIIVALLIPLNNLVLAGNISKYSKDVLIALNSALSSFKYVQRFSYSKHIVREPWDGLPKPSFLERSINLEDWIRQLTAGLVFDVLASSLSVDWQAAIVWSPNFFYETEKGQFEITELTNAIRANTKLKNDITSEFNWFEGWSASPRPYPFDIFKFSVAFFNNFCIFKYLFYSQYTWFIEFESTNEINSALKQKISLPRKYK